MVMMEIRRRYGFVHHQDLEGRPTIILISCRYFPKEVNFDDVKKFAMWLFESTIADMPPHIDQFSAIIDSGNVTHQNVKLAHTKALVPLLQSYYPERLGMAFVINVSLLVRTLWRSIKVFLNQNTIRKIHFLGKKDLHVLGKFFDLNTLPVEYGGYADIKI
jgi:hypothetical protein